MFSCLQRDFVFDSATFLKNLTTQAGIYKMLNVEGEIIYIGKAKNLKNRVSSYFKNPSATPKQQVMVAKIAAIEVTVTETENEALLLECQQIKLHKPRYNICLRDDKSYPYIFLSNHEFPQISLHRGAKRKLGRYFGPYPCSGAARESLKLLQRLFPVRQCEESVYNNRTRPCLQNQIGRCTAPCVGLIDKASYALDVENTVLFLEGKGGILIDQLVVNMDE
ncbi:MAG: GIY-YIG nuclease family protein, partial [Methylococcales bacterium]|nr:GIY-YIG nuclease family protein [Methylococcales bacterium]